MKSILKHWYIGVLILFILSAPLSSSLTKLLDGEFLVTYYTYTPMPENNQYTLERSGNLNIVSCLKKNAETIKKLVPNIQGTSLSSNEFELEKIIDNLNLNIYFTQTLEGGTLYYGFSPKLRSGIKVNGYLINVQIAAYNDHILIGEPLIIGSY